MLFDNMFALQENRKSQNRLKTIGLPERFALCFFLALQTRRQTALSQHCMSYSYRHCVLQHVPLQMLLRLPFHGAMCDIVEHRPCASIHLMLAETARHDSSVHADRYNVSLFFAGATTPGAASHYQQHDHCTLCHATHSPRATACCMCCMAGNYSLRQCWAAASYRQRC